MSPQPPRPDLPTRPGLLTRFGRDRAGVSAIEFALIAPVVIFLYLGVVEFSQGYMAQKRVSHVASMVADLTARRSSINQEQLGDILSVGALIMRPYSTNTLTQRVASVTRISATELRIDWQVGDTEALNVATLTIPDGMIADGETLIISETGYDYDSPVDYVMKGLTHLSHRTYLRPREVDFIPCADC